MSSLVFFTAILILASYALRLNHYSAFEDYEQPESNEQPLITVIIPFKDEEAHLRKLIEGVEKQTYPTDKLTYIFVDDHSTDNGLRVVEEYIQSKPNMIVLPNSGSGKKQAIHTGVLASNTDWIINIDADCIPRSSWIEGMTKRITHNINFIAGPVKLELTKPKSQLQQLLLLEHQALQRLTYLSIRKKQPLMANGANMAFTKSMFLEAWDSDMHHDIPSGDDVFLLFHSYKQNPNSISAVVDPNAAVYTKCAQKYSEAIKQRVRWASKVRAYEGVYHVKETGWIFVLANLTIPSLFLYGASGAGLLFMFLFWILKSGVDYYFTRVIAQRYDQHLSFNKVFFLTLYYPFFLLDVMARAWFVPLKKQ